MPLKERLDDGTLPLVAAVNLSYLSDKEQKMVSGMAEEGECIIFHKHKAFHPYHQHGRVRNLRQAVKSIKGHDVFQMTGRKSV